MAKKVRKKRIRKFISAHKRSLIALLVVGVILNGIIDSTSSGEAENDSPGTSEVPVQAELVGWEGPLGLLDGEGGQVELSDPSDPAESAETTDSEIATETTTETVPVTTTTEATTQTERATTTETSRTTTRRSTSRTTTQETTTQTEKETVPAVTTTTTAATTTIPATTTVPPTTTPVPSVGQLSVSVIDVGQGDSILVQHGGKNMLIDAGDNNKSGVVLGYLKSRGVTHLDYLIATHPHADHIGGMDDVIRSMSVDTIIMPDSVHTTRTFEDLLDAIAAKGVKTKRANPGDSYSLGGTGFTILSAGGSDLNNASVVVRLDYGSTAMLFTGDAEAKVEQALIAQGKPLSADVLKVGHHGSTTSSTDAFIKAVSPKIAVISVGAGNSYGHPNLTIVQRLQNNGSKVYRTDESGTIVITTDGSTLSVNAAPTASVSAPVTTTAATQPATTTQAPPATTAPTTTAAPVPQGNVVYITNTGKRYHRSTCGSLKDSKIESTVEKAIALGLTPCGTCKP